VRTDVPQSEHLAGAGSTEQERLAHQIVAREAPGLNGGRRREEIPDVGEESAPERHGDIVMLPPLVRNGLCPDVALTGWPPGLIVRRTDSC
jgi:hypothetical protein